MAHYGYNRGITMRDFTPEEKELIVNTEIDTGCFEMENFCGNLIIPYVNLETLEVDDKYGASLESRWIFVIDICEKLRQKFLETKNEFYFVELVRLLPNSYKVVKL